MAECELRQRKKEEGGVEDDGAVVQTDSEKMKSCEREQVQTENKPEPVRSSRN